MLHFGERIRARRNVTFVDRKGFSFDSWDDVSEREMPSALRNAALIRVQIDTRIQFGNQATVDYYDRKATEMITGTATLGTNGLKKSPG